MCTRIRFSRLLISLLYTASCWLLLHSSAHAACALLKESGSTVHPLRTGKIRMVSALVTVQMKRYGKADVSCDFLFENTSPDEISAKMGFPARVNDGSQSGLALDLRYFQVFVDGEKKSVRKRKEILGQDELERLQITSDASRQWYTWDALFPPATMVRVQNSHEAALVSQQYRDTFEYPLDTAANWTGKIARAEIEIVYENEQELKERFISAQPESYTIDGNKIKWVFVDFVPRQNILVVEKSYLQRGRAR